MLMLSLPISLFHHQSHKTQTREHADKAVEKSEQREKLLLKMVTVAGIRMAARGDAG